MQFWRLFLYGGAAGAAVGLLGLLFTIGVLGRKLKSFAAQTGRGGER